MEGKKEISSIRSQLRRSVQFSFFIDILFTDIFLLTLYLPYLFRNIFSNLVIEGK